MLAKKVKMTVYVLVLMACLLATVDGAAEIEIGIESTSYTISESIVNLEVCVVIFSGSLDGNIFVTLSSEDGTATAPSDYVALSVVLTLAATSSRVCVDLPIVDDNLVEGTETLTVRLTTSDSAVTLNPDSSIVTITDNDMAIIGTEFTSYTISEGNDLEVCVVIIGLLDKETVVTLSTEDGTATAGSDYEALSANLTFDRSVSRRCALLTTVEDSLVEEAETLTVRLTTSDSAVTLNPETSTVTITDDDTAEIGMEISSYTISEGNDLKMCVVKVSGLLERDTVVTLSMEDGNATAGSDYGALSVDLTFGALVSRGCALVTILVDSLVEGTETLTVRLTTSDTAVTLNPDSSTVTITDDDSTPLPDTTTPPNVTTPTATEEPTTDACASLICHSTSVVVTCAAKPLPNSYLATFWCFTILIVWSFLL